MDVFVLFRPILFISHAVGLAPFKIQKDNQGRFVTKSKLLLCYSVLFLGTNLALLTRELVKEVIYELYRIREPLWSTALIVKIITFFLCTLSTANAVFRVSCTTNVLNVLNMLLHDLKEVEYKILFPSIRRDLILDFILYALCFAHSFMFYYRANLLMQMMPMYSSMFLMNVFTYQFVLIWNSTWLAYKTMNKIIFRDSQPGVIVHEILEDLRKFKQIDIILKDTIEKINVVYMPFVLSYICWIYAIKIHGVMWVLHFDFSIVTIVLFSSYLNAQLVFVLNSTCGAADEAEKTANYLHELFVDNDDPELKEEIEIFSLQLLHRKLELNACGFFQLDFSLLYSMVGAVTTYIVILSQFQEHKTTSYSNCTAVHCNNCTVSS